MSPCWTAGSSTRKHVFAKAPSESHLGFAVSNSWWSNYQWLRGYGSPKHHHSLYSEGLIVARHRNLLLACVLALTLPLAPYSPTTYGKIFQSDCSNLIKESYVAAIYWCSCEPTSSCVAKGSRLMLPFNSHLKTLNACSNSSTSIRQTLITMIVVVPAVD